MSTNTNKPVSGKAANVAADNKANTTNKANKATDNKAKAKANTNTKADKPAQLTPQEIGRILVEYSPASMSALRKLETALTDKYGRSNWISIRAAYQTQVRDGIKAAETSALEAVRAYSPALADSWARIRTNADFVALAAYINVTADTLAKAWESGPAFVAATFPNTINGEPATRVSYVTAHTDTDKPGYIVDAYQPANLSAASVPGILSACIRNIAKAARTYVGKVSETLARVETTAHKAGQVVAVYLAAFDESGTATKGTAAKAETAATIAKAGTAGLDTLRAYNKAVSPAE